MTRQKKDDFDAGPLLMGGSCECLLAVSLSNCRITSNLYIFILICVLYFSRSSYLLWIQTLQTQKEVHQHKVFRLHGNGRDQTWIHCNWTVGLMICIVFTSKTSAWIYLCNLHDEAWMVNVALQVQEAHRLQKEETAASNEETTLSPSSSDITQGQLSRSMQWTLNLLFQCLTLTSTSRNMWRSTSSHVAIQIFPIICRK